MILFRVRKNSSCIECAIHTEGCTIVPSDLGVKQLQDFGDLKKQIEERFSLITSPKVGKKIK
jgi:hypothetical protein